MYVDANLAEYIARAFNALLLQKQAKAEPDD
jgi:hypothetical protein